MLRLAARLREAGTAPLVGAGFLNYSRPPLAEALARLRARGATAVTVLPYFLVPGYFTGAALPRALDGLRAANPDLPITQVEPLGAHPALADLVRRRAVAAGAVPGSAVLLAAHGSPDPASNTPVYTVARMLAAQGAFAAVGVCFLGLNEPDIPTAIAAHVARGDDSIVVVPYLLQLGGHAAEDLPAAIAEAQARHPAAHLVLAAYLGYDPAIAEVLVARAAGAVDDGLS